MDLPALLDDIQISNSDRAELCQRFVGGILFIISMGMVTFCICTAIFQAYLLPLSRFTFLPGHANPRASVAYHLLILVVIYFIVLGAGGFPGWFIVGALYFLWGIGMMIYVLAKGTKASDEMAASPSATVDASAEGTSGDPTDENSGRAWAVAPAPWAPGQMSCWIFSFVCTAIFLMTALLLIYFMEIKPYYVLESTSEKEEYQPHLTAAALQMMYAFPRFATNMRLQLIVKWTTQYCGTTFSKTITSNSSKESSIKAAWIDKYSINMTEYVPSDYREYSSVDDWFTRRINLNYRPLPSDPNAIVSPADARTLVFAANNETRVWLKGSPVSLDELTGGIAGTYWNDGSVLISRLAPQDYHCFHSPVTGVVTHSISLSGPLWSVSSDAARSRNGAFLNQRKVVVINTTNIGLVAYVAIGATCVGSVIIHDTNKNPINVGDTLTAGDLMGCMHFGGSTVITLFQAGKVQFDEQLLENSRYPVETLMKARSQIGDSV